MEIDRHRPVPNYLNEEARNKDLVGVLRSRERHVRLWKKALSGCGVALRRAAKALIGLKLEGDEQIGVNIIRRACEEPIRQIVQNSGVIGAPSPGGHGGHEGMDY